MSEEDPIYQFNKISQEMREAQNATPAAPAPQPAQPAPAPAPQPAPQPQPVQPAAQQPTIGIITPGENGFNEPVNPPQNNGQM